MTTETPSTSTGVVIDDADRGILASGGEQVKSVLTQDPQTEERILLLLGKRLDGEMNAETWGILFSGLVALLGEDGATLIAWAANTEPSPIDLVEESVAPDVTRLVRGVIANYGNELRRAYELWNELPDNWRVVNREVYHDLINNRPHIRLTIEKYSGEVALIEGPGDSILTLARSIIAALNRVGTRESFAEDRIQDFVADAEELLKMLRPREEPVSTPADAEIDSSERAQST